MQLKQVYFANYKILLLSVVFMLTNFTMLSQVVTVKGRLISSVNGNGIFGGFVQVENGLGTTTDELGNFEITYFDVNKKYNLRLSAFGYLDLDTTIITKNQLKIDGISYILKANCDIGKSKAKEDIKKGKPKLLLFGSIAPIGNTKRDLKFEEKFKVKYFDFGCTPPAFECMEEYNKEIFKYLDNEYDRHWRKKVRIDVWALSE